MSLAAGQHLGPYEILAPLGAGGMGEVYLARDAKLQRDVALKVLPAGFAFDADRLARFKREAQILASLNHPNIAAIFGFEHADGIQALVLELVEGPTLADHLRRGPIPAAEAIPIARQIAEALEAAHNAGIVHRDLKPANVKLRPDGTVKVLDFGLAKAVEPSTDTPSHATVSPTITSPSLTERGIILGTAAYMSPEQAKGRSADKRSDVWALGVVLYEMLSGRRPFRGEDVGDTLAAILRADPNWSELAPETAPALQRLLRRCLQKDPRRRWQHIGDVRLELAEIEDTAENPQSSVPRTRGASGAVLLAVAVLATAIGTGIGRWFSPREQQTVPQSIAFTLALAKGERLANTARFFGISRDGRHVAYGAVKDGRSQLFLRALDQSDAVAIAGTENGTYPVFSPDGGSIAFIADGWLRHVPITGGTPTTVTPVSAPRGLAWGPGDRIVFAAGATSGLSIVSASGGTPERLTDLDRDKAETNHRWPVMLPDGSGVLFAVQRRSRTELDLEGVSFQTRTRTAVRTDGFPVQVLDSGHLVYTAVNGDTFMAPFDVSRMALTGPPVPLSERPSYGGVPGFTSIAVSPGGTVVSMPLREPVSSLVVIGRDGASRQLAVPPRNYQQVVISPNGERIAAVVKSGLAEWDIWTMDARGEAPFRRLTVSRFNVWPVWEPDNATLIYSAFEDRTWKLVSRNVDLSESPRQLWSGPPQEPRVLGWLPGRSLAYTLILPQQNLYAVKDGERSQAIPTPDTGRFDRVLSGFSPDGRWLAYASSQSGQREAYVTAVPEGGVTRQVSRNGGNFPVWAKTRQQLYYRRIHPDKPDEIVSVMVNPDGSIGPPTIVATGDYADGEATFDVFPDGSLLMIQELPADDVPLTVVVNWTGRTR